jgi:NAD(P)-dependent dehydrogenase (short-subunit alcohol dehydrogenase family)
MGWAGVAGKRVVITGGTSGIGLAAAEELAMRGAKLLIVARNEGKASRVANRLGADVVIADLASKKATRRAANEILARCKSVDVLVNNAGVYQTSRTLTEDWIETTWAVNHIATFMLTNLLLERLEDSAPSRIVTTASDAHMNAAIPFDDLDGTDAYAKRSMAGPGFVRYGQTKLANILFTAELARRLEGTRVTANCFHPGFVATGITRDLRGPARLTVKVMNAFARKPSRGAETLVWLAESPDLEGVNGGYFADKRRIEPAPAAQDATAARRLWEVSEIQAGLSAIAIR